MLQIKRGIDQQDIKIVDLQFVQSEYFEFHSLKSFGSRQRDTT